MKKLFQPGFEFSKKLLKGWDSIINETVEIFKHGHPLQFELSGAWGRGGKNRVNIPLKLRELNKDVYEINYEKLHFKPVSLDDKSLATGICSECHDILWGDNYVLAAHSSNIDDKYNVPICPICLHNYEPPLEMHYFRLFRTTFPHSVYDMLESPKISAAKKDILKSVLAGITFENIKIFDTDLEYICIGDKYVAFTNCDNFLFTGVMVHPEFINKKICQVRLIG